MRTVLLASMRRHTRRYVAASLAVLIGVTFIIVTNALSSAAKDGMTSGLDAPYQHADVVVSDIDGDQAASLLARAEKQRESASVLGWAWLAVSRDGTELSDGADVGALPRDESLRWQELVDGRFPTADDEAVVDANAAKGNDVALGDTLTIGKGRDALDVKVVGTVDSPSSMVWTAVYLTQDAQARWLDQSTINSVAWQGRGSVADQVDGLQQAYPDATVQTTDDFVADQQKLATNGVDVIAIILLLFAAIAIATSVMVIANTFSILFAQRTRDFALLRCVGATKRQVLRSIRLEALVLGIVSSLIGLLAGTALGLGLVALIRTQAPSARLGEASFSPVWFAGAFVLGIVVTVIAAWLPTRRATRVSPLAALRPDTGVDVRTTTGRLRIGLGILMVGVGGLAMTAAIAGTAVPLMVVGGMATFFGVVVLGPTIVPALIRVAGSLTARLIGTPGRLATSNAVRNPRRTAATTASLLVGVTLTTAVLTGLASGRSIIDDEMATDHPLDASVSATTGGGLDAEVLHGVRDLPAVEDAIAIPGTAATIDHRIGALRVVAPGGDAGDLMRSRPDFAAPGADEIYLPIDALEDGTIPTEVTVTVGDHTRTLGVRSGEDWGNVAVVAPQTLAALDAHPATQAIWISADLDTDAEDFSGDLSAVASSSDAAVESTLGKWAFVDLQLDVMTGAIVGLLGIAVVIALIGIANTLGLSVLERGRENALLRALGLTRRQLRATLATEAVLLSVVATLLGTGLGIAFAWVGVQTMLRSVVDEVTMTLPLGQLAVVVLISAAAGLLACVLPARRAARVTPAAGLTLE
ncbi:ABC transporter permease [Nocardioides jensenii]|uniref:ABC transporter permease n=1 Tax=Nocardioides jensenii TaxID=1843 RepID=UPI00083644DF|nr:ABC transporter permease [Nocardioides jensenii]